MRKIPAEKAQKNKKTFFILRLLLLLPIFVLVVFLFQAKALADDDASDSYKKLTITELMYDPEGTNSVSSDWIEIYNPTSKKIILEKGNFGIIDKKELRFSSDGSKYLNCHSISSDIEIGSKNFIVIAENKNRFEDNYSNIENVFDSVFNLSSSGDYIRLSNDRCITFFYEMSYENSWGAKDNGKTLEKIDFEKNDSSDNWQESYIDGGTPGELNSQKPSAKNYDFEIYINEVFPAPGEGKDEFIEILNNENKDISLFGWILRDASKSGKYTFPKEAIILAKSYLTIYKKDFKFALNNSGKESVTLFSPAETRISELNYTGSKKDFAYALDGSAWRWTSHPSPGKENVFDKKLSGKVLKDKTIYKNTYADFEVKTDHDAKKFTWDFGDGHKSYLQKTRHKYEKTGTYHASLKIRGNGEDASYEFDVTVKKYKAPKLRIVRISPNPKGSDAENEWIEIENKSKKKINLKGWSIATGWDNLYNHPIRGDFKIKPGKSKKLPRDICAFTLANTKTKIELRDPSGKAVQKIEYNSGKKSIKEEAVYEKEVGNGWIWIEPPEKEKANTARTEESTAVPSSVPTSVPTPADINLGKYSPDPSWQEKRDYQIELATFNSALRIPAPIVANQPQVLGTRTILYSGKYYFFTESLSQKHWLVKFCEDVWIKMNSELNQIMNKI